MNTVKLLTFWRPLSIRCFILTLVCTITSSCIRDEGNCVVSLFGYAIPTNVRLMGLITSLFFMVGNIASNTKEYRLEIEKIVKSEEYYRYTLHHGFYLNRTYLAINVPILVCFAMTVALPVAFGVDLTLSIVSCVPN